MAVNMKLASVTAIATGLALAGCAVAPTDAVGQQPETPVSASPVLASVPTAGNSRYVRMTITDARADDGRVAQCVFAGPVNAGAGTGQLGGDCSFPGESTQELFIVYLTHVTFLNGNVLAMLPDFRLYEHSGTSAFTDRQILLAQMGASPKVLSGVLSRDGQPTGKVTLTFAK